MFAPVVLVKCRPTNAINPSYRKLLVSVAVGGYTYKEETILK